MVAQLVACLARITAPVFMIAYILALFAVLLADTRAVQAATIVVAPGVVDVDGGDGLCSLNEAIENANDDAATHADCPAGAGADTIELVAGATYTVTNNLGGGWGVEGINSELTISGKGATIRRQLGGGNFGLMNVFPGGDLTLRNLTLESGANQTTGGGAIYSSGRLTTINVTFRNNYALTENGGAILVNVQNQGSALRVLNSTFDGNHAGLSGGAIYASGDAWAFEVRGSTFNDNHAGNNGGAIYFSQDPATGLIAYSTFSGNDVYAGDGGAIHVPSTGGTFLLDHLTLDGNETTTSQQGGGGAIYVGGGAAVELFASEVTNNHAWNGGAIVTTGGDFTLSHSALRGNRAENLGGAVHSLSGAQGTIRFTEIYSNSAGYRGGGLFLDSNINTTRVNAFHTTFSGNHSDDDGGAIFNITSVVTLTYVSLVGNNAAESGGAIYNTGRSGTNGKMTLWNSVILDNSGGSSLGSRACYNGTFGTWISEGYNRYQTNATGGCTNTLFSATGDEGVGGPASDVIDLTLADNGGRTRTHAIVAVNTTESLWNKVPAGSGQRCRAGDTLDQRGHVRAGGVAGGTKCDVGAYEHNAQCAVPVAPAVTIAVSDNDVTLSWSEPPENWSSEIWRDEEPYFDPTAPGNKMPFNVLGESHTFFDESGNGPNSRFYAVRGVAACGDVSATVERVGLFEFTLVPGT